jgi:hypothetical protein
MDWFSAALGWLFLRTVVGGSVLLGMFYVAIGSYVFAAAILLPLVAVLAWMISDVRGDWPPELPDE